MVSSSYTPGTWLGVVRSGTAVLLAPATPPALVDSLWELLAREPEVHEVLHAVTSASSGSLAQIPWFGIVEFRDSLRVFLRGDIELTAQLAAGPVELNGSDVTTWTERRLSAPESYKVSVPGDAPPGAAPNSRWGRALCCCRASLWDASPRPCRRCRRRRCRNASGRNGSGARRKSRR